MAGSRLGGPVLQSAQIDGSRQYFSHMPLKGDPDHALYFNDFLVNQDYTASDWTVTVAGGGAVALGDERGGVLASTTTAVITDLAHIQHTIGTFQFIPKQSLWFEARVRLDAPSALMTFFIGLMEKTVDPLNAQNMVGWQIRTGDPRPRAIAVSGGSITPKFAEHPIIAGQYTTLGFVWDGSGLQYFHNREWQWSTRNNVPQSLALHLTQYLKNDEAFARAATIDYFLVVTQRG